MGAVPRVRSGYASLGSVAGEMRFQPHSIRRLRARRRFRRLRHSQRVRKLVPASAHGHQAKFGARAVGVEGGCLLWSLAYLAVRKLEILVLRHELAMLRRQARQPNLTRADRGLLAALSRSLPRAAWAGFPVKPGTLLRWHRQLVARRWTHAHRAPRSATARVVAARADPAARPREPALGIQTYRRRTQRHGHLCVCDLGAEGAA